MTPKFSITIEADANGNLSYWCQKGLLTPEQEKRFTEVKERIERLCTPVKQREMFTKES